MLRSERFTNLGWDVVRAVVWERGSKIISFLYFRVTKSVKMSLLRILSESKLIINANVGKCWYLIRNCVSKNLSVIKYIGTHEKNEERNNDNNNSYNINNITKTKNTISSLNNKKEEYKILKHLISMLKQISQKLNKTLNCKNNT